MQSRACARALFPAALARKSPNFLAACGSTFLPLQVPPGQECAQASAVWGSGAHLAQNRRPVRYDSGAQAAWACCFESASSGLIRNEQSYGRPPSRLKTMKTDHSQPGDLTATTPAWRSAVDETDPGSKDGQAGCVRGGAGQHQNVNRMLRLVDGSARKPNRAASKRTSSTSRWQKNRRKLTRAVPRGRDRRELSAAMFWDDNGENRRAPKPNSWPKANGLTKSSPIKSSKQQRGEE